MLNKKFVIQFTAIAALSTLVACGPTRRIAKPVEPAKADQQAGNTAAGPTAPGPGDTAQANPAPAPAGPTVTSNIPAPPTADQPTTGGPIVTTQPTEPSQPPVVVVTAPTQPAPLTPPASRPTTPVPPGVAEPTPGTPDVPTTLANAIERVGASFANGPELLVKLKDHAEALTFKNDAITPDGGKLFSNLPGYDALLKCASLGCSDGKGIVTLQHAGETAVMSIKVARTQIPTFNVAGKPTGAQASAIDVLKSASADSKSESVLTVTELQDGSKFYDLVVIVAKGTDQAQSINLNGKVGDEVPVSINAGGKQEDFDFVTTTYDGATNLLKIVLPKTDNGITQIEISP